MGSRTRGHPPPGAIKLGKTPHKIIEELLEMTGANSEEPPVKPEASNM